MSEKNNPDELDTLFKDFEQKFAECQQKITDIEKNLDEFRKEKNEDLDQEAREKPES